jgi:hypothetical protein
MDWLRIALIAFATFTAWEWLIVVSAVVIPAALQPVLVVAIAYGVQRLPLPWLAALAGAGMVALLHAAVRSGGAVPPRSGLRVPRRQHPSTGRRVPDLP